jgi:Fe-S cluster assembly protein SufD
MNALAPTALQSAATSFLARFETSRGGLPGDLALRDAAAEQFRAAGLPGPREEAWHYTSLQPLGDAVFTAPRPDADGGASLGRLSGISAPRLVFVDGFFRAELSDVPASVQLRTGSPAFGPLARPGCETLVALNTMLAGDGAAITVAEGVDAGTLVLASIGTPGVAFHPRHAIHLAAGARLALIEIAIGSGAYLHNPVTEATVEQSAHLTHLRLQDEAAEAFHLSTIYADVAAGGTYDSFALTTGARLARLEVHARLGGAKAAAHLNAAQLLSGHQHSDFTTVVAHEAPATTSRQTVKNVLTDRARGVFQGRIEVARVAQKTDGYQMTQTLLLSPEAEIDCKPQLQIFADDVKCSHGSTVGDLDPDQFFYLRSRGIAPEEARSILVRAFLAEALDPIGHPDARAVLEAAVDMWWQRQAA